MAIQIKQKGEQKGMTKEALRKLNEKQMEYCETMSALIERHRKAGAKEQYERDSGKLRGYLECLEQIGTIKQSELKVLYLWFFAEDRNKGKS